MATIRVVGSVTGGRRDVVQSECKQTLEVKGGNLSFHVEKFREDHRRWANIRYDGTERGLIWMQFVASTMCRQSQGTEESFYYETEKCAGVVTDFHQVYGDGHFNQFQDVQERGGERHLVVLYSNPSKLRWVTDTTNSTCEYGGRRAVQSREKAKTEMWDAPSDCFHVVALDENDWLSREARERPRTLSQRIEDGIMPCGRCFTRPNTRTQAMNRDRENALEIAAAKGWKLVTHDFFQAYLLQIVGEHEEAHVLARCDYEVVHTQCPENHPLNIQASIINVRLCPPEGASGFRDDVSLLAQREVEETLKILRSARGGEEEESKLGEQREESKQNAATPLLPTTTAATPMPGAAVAAGEGEGAVAGEGAGFNQRKGVPPPCAAPGWPPELTGSS